jgi:hypothetical protein
MANVNSSPALLAALAALMAGESPAVWAQEWPGNHQPRLEITQSLLSHAAPGKAFSLDVRIRNLGSGTARSVYVYEKLPDGAELLEAAPIPSRQQNVLVWSLATLKPGEEYNVRLRLRADNVPSPVEWPSKVRVAYQAEVGNVSPIAEVGNVSPIDLKRPRIELNVAAPKYVLLGEPLPVAITVSNAGTRPGRRLNLTALVSGGLTHESGTDLENAIGDLPAGKSCTITLPLSTQRTGKGYAQLRLTGDEIGLAHQSLVIDIRDAHVDLGIHGPTTAAADWACTYNFVVTNQGNEPLPPTKLAAEMPKNLTYVRASGNGVYDAASHSVIWELPECRQGESLTYDLSGVARDGPAEGGCLKVLHDKHEIKKIPWVLRLLERSGGGPPLPPANDRPRHGGGKK